MSTRIGLEVDRVAFDVERGKIREFARATFSTDPVHVDQQVAQAVVGSVSWVLRKGPVGR